MIMLGILGAFLAVVFLICLHTCLVISARKKARIKGTGRKVKFMDPIITSEDERYSLSRFQMYLWTFVVIVGFVAVTFAKCDFAVIPQNLYLLMGVNLGASVASTAISTWKNSPLGKEKGEPDFVRDIFFETEDSIDLPRTQMFAWTIISLIIFAWILVKSFANCDPKLPDVPIGLVALMGVSHGAYLGAKAVTKGKAS